MLQKTPDRVRILGEFADYMDCLPPNKLIYERWCACIAGHAIKEYGSDEDKAQIARGKYYIQLPMAEASLWPFETAKEILHLTKDEAWDLFVRRFDTFGTYDITPKMVANKLRELMFV